MASTAPSLTILMTPACSATNSRPLLSPACAISTGLVRPFTTRRSVMAGGAAAPDIADASNNAASSLAVIRSPRS